jgi:hypothetical protein
VGSAPKPLTVHTLGAVTDHVELPELAGGHLAHINFVVAGAVVALGGSQARLAGQALFQAVESGRVGGACALLGLTTGSGGQHVTSVGNCKAQQEAEAAAAAAAGRCCQQLRAPNAG